MAFLRSFRQNPAVRIDVLTLFPGMFTGPLSESILKRAREAGHFTLRIHDIRDQAKGVHRQVDDRPYGGGAGMVMMAEPVAAAIEAASASDPLPDAKPRRIFLTPGGERLTQAAVERLAKEPWLLLLCGHYEGVDQRVKDAGLIDEEISIGDYVLTGGELPAMVLIDAVARHLPGVLGHEDSAAEESFSPALNGKREYPHYTRPEEFRGLKVPDILLSGDHKKIAEWRQANTR
jgi:tRNA (guanine37-N1)-methyltransferase